MKNKPTITLVIPTINEIEGLKVVFPRIDRSLFDEVLVIDASSTDGTVEYISKYPDVKFVTQKSKGMQNAMMEMLEIVNTDYIVEFSPDNNCIPEQLPDIISKIYEGYDIVVVSRYLGEATSEDDTIISGFGNWMFSKMIRYLGKFPITDALTLYKGYKSSIPKEKLFNKYLSTDLIFEPLLSAYSNLKGYKYAEIPGTEPARIGGESTLPWFKAGLCISLFIVRLYVKKIFKITL
mgnify:CR=1 FL=1|tara:strand:- start:795 stop:1502 length:708 start_codon:yes stop_codon:yes gene_type:complete